MANPAAKEPTVLAPTPNRSVERSTGAYASARDVSRLAVDDAGRMMRSWVVPGGSTTLQSGHCDCCKRGGDNSPPLPTRGNGQDPCGAFTGRPRPGTPPLISRERPKTGRAVN